MVLLDRSNLPSSITCIAWASLVMATLATTGCGSGTVAVSTPGAAPTITGQPANTTVPLGSTATLTVAATGSGSLTYQWTEDGNLIPGATAASFTTDAAQSTDSGDKFAVTVTNSYGSVISDLAIVTVGPRSPAQRDMRFKHVQLSSTLQETFQTQQPATISGSMATNTFTGQFGTPMGVGNQICGTSANLTSCAWPVEEFGAATGVQGFNSADLLDSLTSMNADLTQLAANSVVTSLDEQNGPGFAYGLVAYSVETDPTVTGGFTLQQTHVTDGTLAATVSAMAAKGVVVTAASVNPTGGVDLVGYAWSGDQGTTYEAQAVLTTYADLGPQAVSLAQQGYIITAAGTADFNQVLLVGTKVQGDSLPRNLHYFGPQQQSGGTGSPGQITVGNFFGNDAGNDPNLPGYSILLEQ
jgi:hypothetical protein